MKNKVVAVILAIGICAGFVGCSREYNSSSPHAQFGQFVILHEELYVYHCNTYRQYIVYDKETMVMYIIDTRGYGTAISPYYVVDKDGNATVGIYNGDKEW